VLLSGGLDSAVALAAARREGYARYCLSIDYSQRHRCELEAAGRVAAQLGAVDHRVVKVDLRAIGGSALTADIEVPKDADPSRADIPVTYTPARNLIFLSIALGHAEVVGARDIFIGVNAIDYSGYPDCRREFIEAFEHTARLATRDGVSEAAEFRVRTPLVDLRKEEIIRLGAELGVDFSLTHSCYDPTPGGLACARCDSCQLRRRGFEQAGIPDPTRYATPQPTGAAR
jgi:7-cyano-7-deazaguanine synthase